MGMRFRKSVKFGPVKINLSKSGVGYSVGTKGYRVTKRADGKVQRTVSIPGTGISHVTVSSGKKTAAKPAEKTAYELFEAKNREAAKHSPWKTVSMACYILGAILTVVSLNHIMETGDPMLLLGAIVLICAGVAFGVLAKSDGKKRLAQEQNQPENWDPER